MSKTKPKAKNPSPRKTRESRPQAKAPPIRVRSGAKLATVLDMLRRPEGASLEALMKATGWQKHSVRGAIAGAIKKKLKLPVESARRDDGQRVYRIPT